MSNVAVQGVDLLLSWLSLNETTPLKCIVCLYLAIYNYIYNVIGLPSYHSALLTGDDRSWLADVSLARQPVL